MVSDVTQPIIPVHTTGAMDRVLKPRPADGADAQPWNKTGAELTEQLEHQHAADSEGGGSGERKLSVEEKF